MPSDHAPLVIDLDEPGHPFDAGWASAEGRIAARRGSADGRDARRFPIEPPIEPMLAKLADRAARRATAGSSSRSGTASARSCSATATASTSRAAT